MRVTMLCWSFASLPTRMARDVLRYVRYFFCLKCRTLFMNTHCSLYEFATGRGLDQEIASGCLILRSMSLGVRAQINEELV